MKTEQKTNQFNKLLKQVQGIVNEINQEGPTQIEDGYPINYEIDDYRLT